MSYPNKKITGRAEFIKKLVKAGFKYVDATRAYESFMSTIADGIASGSKVCLGNVGALEPTTVPPRQIRMGFSKGKGGKIQKIAREYFLDSRLKFKFRLYKGFVEKHHLDWTSS
jgi:nucleoid DNA-binding protein